MSPQTNKFGYLTIRLCRDGKKHNFTIHKLVAITFLKNTNNYPEINHKNGIKADNRVKNLEWCNRSQNIKHAHEMGLAYDKKGENHGRSKIKESDIYNIIELRNSGKTLDFIGKLYQVTPQNIYQIVKRKSWKHINI